jgi:hypothetical protein
MLMTVLCVGRIALASESHSTPSHDQPHHESPGPVVSNDTHWSGGLVIGIVAMFIAAAVIGPIYRASMPEEPPVADAHGHDDDHGHGHDDHGHGGHGGHH